MAEDNTEARIMVAPDVIYLGHDDRKWKVFWMGPMAQTEGSEEAPRKIARIQLQEKVVELFQQATAMRVFVNPDPLECDELLVGGKTLFIKTPQADGGREEVAARGGSQPSGRLARGAPRGRRGEVAARGG